MAEENKGVMPIINMVNPKSPVSDLVMSRLQDRVAQAQLQGIQEQRVGLADTKKRLQELQSQPQQKDLSALAAITDLVSGSGGQFSQLYQYAKPKDQTKEVQQLERLLSQQRMGLADDELNLLKAQFQGVKDQQKMDLNLSPGQKKLDEAFGKEYADYYAAGGYADIQKGLAQLREAKASLESSDNITGPLVGSIPEAFGLKRKFAPEAAATQQAVEEVVQRNLRLILGAQFTEKEGKRLIERAYDPAASEEENSKRVGRLLDQMQEAADAKQSAAEYFEQYGTLKGYKATNRYKSPSDFLKEENKASTKATYKTDAAKKLAEEFGL